MKITLSLHMISAVFVLSFASSIVAKEPAGRPNFGMFTKEFAKDKHVMFLATQGASVVQTYSGDLKEVKECKENRPYFRFIEKWTRELQHTDDNTRYESYGMYDDPGCLDWTIIQIRVGTKWFDVKPGGMLHLIYNNSTTVLVYAGAGTSDAGFYVAQLGVRWEKLDTSETSEPFKDKPNNFWIDRMVLTGEDEFFVRANPCVNSVEDKAKKIIVMANKNGALRFSLDNKKKKIVVKSCSIQKAATWFPTPTPSLPTEASSLSSESSVSDSAVVEQPHEMVEKTMAKVQACAGQECLAEQPHTTEGAPAEDPPPSPVPNSPPSNWQVQQINARWVHQYSNTQLRSKNKYVRASAGRKLVEVTGAFRMKDGHVAQVSNEELILQDVQDPPENRTSTLVGIGLMTVDGLCELEIHDERSVSGNISMTYPRSGQKISWHFDAAAATSSTSFGQNESYVCIVFSVPEQSGSEFTLYFGGSQFPISVGLRQPIAIPPHIAMGGEAMGPAVPASAEQLAAESALGKKLNRSYLAYQRSYPTGEVSFSQYLVNHYEKKKKKGALILAIGLPVSAALIIGGSIYGVSTEDWENAGSTVGVGVVHLLAASIAGGIILKRNNERIRRLTPLLHQNTTSQRGRRQMRLFLSGMGFKQPLGLSTTFLF
ncbi:MAG: hypothetical protein JXX29_14285 [Deltaproteobacteria bacterium]|nr:hypothetical protein [Deltaproteobacteria bacterium]MBN2672847.1 hypothetical protein [Deltaproteobacteria bacterium]